MAKDDDKGSDRRRSDRNGSSPDTRYWELEKSSRTWDRRVKDSLRRARRAANRGAASR